MKSHSSLHDRHPPVHENPQQTVPRAWFYALCLCFLLLMPGVSSLATAAQNEPAPQETAHSERLPGVEIASEVSQLTGMAISPLLGASVVGAWRYYRTEETARAQLPWHAHPAFWGTGLVILLVIFFKDAIGATLPAVFKKPLDMLELFENKISALLVAGLILPSSVAHITRLIQQADPVSGTPPPVIHYASVLPWDLPDLALGGVLLVVFSLVFFTVWLSAHAINVLIALSPSSLLDTLLKLFKLGVLGAVAIPTLIHPVLGAAVSLLVIAVAIWVAAPAFRLMVFGSLMALDILLFWRKATHPNNPRVFNARALGKLPARTLGHLVSAPDGSLNFTYRPWLVLPRRTVSLTASQWRIERGMLFPSLSQSVSDTESRWQRLFVFLPRYRGQEASLVQAFGFSAPVHDNAMRRGLSAARLWLKEMLEPRPLPPASTA